MRDPLPAGPCVANALHRHVLSKADIRADDLSGRLLAPDARWHCRVLTALISNEEMRLEKRVRSDLQLASRSLTVAGAAQVGSSVRTSLPASRLTAHANMHARAPRWRECKSGSG